MRFIAAKAFGADDAEMLAAPPRPALHGAHVIVDAVLLHHPIALAFMRGKHRALAFKLRRHIDGEIAQDLGVVAVAAFDGIGEIEMRNGGQGRRAAGPVVDDGRGETGVAHQQAGGLVIGMIVGRRRRDDELGLKRSDQLRRATARSIVVEHAEIAEARTMIVRTDHRRRSSGFGLADARGFFIAPFDRPAIAGRHRGDSDAMTVLREQRQRAGAQCLDVVGMGMDG